MKKENNIHLTADDIHRYVNGEMSHSEMHELEKHALECSFCAEALEGVEKNIDSSLMEDIQELDLRFEKQLNTGRGDRKQRKIPVYWMRYAAIFIPLIVVSAWFITSQLSDNPPQLAERKEQTNPVSDSLKSKKKTESKTENKNWDAETQKEEFDKTNNERFDGNKNDTQPATPNVSFSTSNKAIAETVDDEPNYWINSFEGEPKEPIVSDKLEEDVEAQNQPIVSGQMMQSSRVRSEGLSNLEELDSMVELDRFTKPLEIEAENEDVVVQEEKRDEEFSQTSSSLSRSEKSRVKHDRRTIAKGNDLSEEKDCEPAPTLEQAIPSSGWEAFFTYLREHIEHAPEQGTIWKVDVQFDENGKVSKVKVKPNLSQEKRQEFIQLIEEGPAWVFPSNEKDGLEIRSSFTLVF